MKVMRRLAAVLVFSVFLQNVSAVGCMKVQAAPSDTQQQIDKKEEEKKELEGNLDETEKEVEGLKGEHSSLQGELNNLNKQLGDVSSNLENLEAQIEAKEREIAQTGEVLAQARATEEEQYRRMVTNVRYMYEFEERNVAASLLSMGSFADMLNMADFYDSVMDYSKKLMKEYEASRILIEEEEARLQAEMAQLEQLKVQAEAEKSKVSGLISKTSNSIAQYADQIAEAEERARAYEERIKEAEKDLDALWKKLKEELALSQAAANAVWRDISEVTFDEGDRYLLANLIYCEAGGEPYEGKLAVASVVINRVLSSKFPNTVVGVIYQNKQFSPVASGRLDLALAAGQANAQCYQAADAAMSGATNVGQCVFFRTPVEGLSGINIGGHVFY